LFSHSRLRLFPQRSTKLVGSLQGNDIAGTYESTAAEEPARGTWIVSRS